jgi:hypothetical protein
LGINLLFVLTIVSLHTLGTKLLLLLEICMALVLTLILQWLDGRTLSR